MKPEATDVFLTADVAEAIKNAAATLQDIVSCDSGIMLDASSSGTITRIQAAMRHRSTDPLERRICEVILTSCVNAERVSPGGFSLCMSMISAAVRDDLLGKPVIDHELLAREAAADGSQAATLSSVHDAINRHTQAAPRRIKAMLTRALDLAGFGGRIVVEKTHSVTPSVELIRGYTFETQPAFDVSAVLERPRVIAIDGLVESVAEIHRILEDANASKETALLFVRGAHPDVITTLKTNFDRGTLKIVPFIVPMELAGINTLKDVAIVAGGDVVSSLKGELISTIEFSKQPRIASAIVHARRAILVSPLTSESVSSHVSDLIRRRATCEDALGKLYDDRIKSLSPNHVVIRLPDDADFVVSAQAIDFTVREISSLAERGVTRDGRPLATVFAASVQARRCSETLRSLGAAVIAN